MIQTPKFEIRPLINLALRRKWWFIIPFALSIIGGGIFLLLSPKLYKASTLILLEPQSIPESFVRSTVAETMEGRVRTIAQQINSRTNLEKIAREFRLDEQKSSGVSLGTVIRALSSYLPFLNRADSISPQSKPKDHSTFHGVVQQLQKNLQVNTHSGSRGGEQTMAFEISLQWNDQEVVAPVTNAIAARFIEENMSVREGLAIGATDFFDKETLAIKSELEAREQDLEKFKREHMGMLPTELGSNINILSQLREQVVSLERRLDQEKQQAFIVKSQAEIARMERLAGSRVERGMTTGRGNEPRMTVDQLTTGSLDDLEAELKRLRSFYTDKHPDIVALKMRIETLRKEGRSTGPGEDFGLRAARDRTSVQLSTINANIESYTREIAAIEKEIEIYKDRVEATPRVEMEMSKVLRDYQTVRERYDNLLSKKMDSKLAEQLEKRKKGEQFKVLDPAVKPPRPYKPDPLRIMFMAISAGLGLGGALAYIREVLDPGFYHPEELEAYLGTNVIVSLPMASKEVNI